MAETRPIPWANWNGQQMPLDQVLVPATDRGFLFADAIYEAIRVYRGHPWLLREHTARLRRSLDEIRLVVDVERLSSRLEETLRASQVQEGLIYIQVTRGAAPRAHAFPANASPNELIYIQDYGTDPYHTKRSTGVAVVTFADLRWQRCDIKSTNLLANCLAKQAAADANAYEALLVSADGFITEATHSSVIGVMDSRLLATPLSPGILPGVTRAFVAELAKKAGLTWVDQSIHRDELMALDELFLTGTTSEVLPIVEVDGHRFGSGQPGPISRLLGLLYQNSVAEHVGQVITP